MKYCVTIEQTRRFSMCFDASNDEAAEKIAHQINQKAADNEFTAGDEERDYTLFNEDTQTTLIDWC